MDYSTKGTSALLPVSWSGDWMRYASLTLSLSFSLYTSLSVSLDREKQIRDFLSSRRSISWVSCFPLFCWLNGDRC